MITPEATLAMEALEAMERVGVTRYAEGFDTLEECRARFAELKAQLRVSPADDDADPGLCLFTLRPDEEQGVFHWTVAILATDALSLTERIVPRGQPVELPTQVWLQLLLKAYDAERAQAAGECSHVN
jgi:hypothetical protein